MRRQLGSSRPTTQMDHQPLLRALPLTEAIGMTETMMQKVIVLMTKGNSQGKIFFTNWMAHMSDAMARPITRPQLITANCQRRELLHDRALWAWAATQSLKAILEQSNGDTSTSTVPCCTCATATTLHCERCDGPLCITCEFGGSLQDETQRCGNCFYRDKPRLKATSCKT